MKFWPGDWRADPAVRSVSLAARGLWIEMIALMHEAEPYGHLTINGRPMALRQLAANVGTSEEVVAALLDELHAAGVFSQDEAGLIWSRRMVRDRDAAINGAEAVQRRWRKAADKRDPNRVPNSPPNSLEAEAEAENYLSTSNEVERSSPAPAGDPPPPDKQPPDPLDEARPPRGRRLIPAKVLWECVAIWNEVCAARGLPSVRDLTRKRAQRLRSRIYERWEEDPARRFRAYCRRITQSAFLTGENPRGWRADFDWAVRSAENVLAVAEGKYHGGEAGAGA